MLCGVLIGLSADAWAQNLIWVRQYQGISWGAAVDQNGNVFVASNVVTSGRRESVLRKFDAFGNGIWTLTLGDPVLDFTAWALAVDGSGNILVAGWRGGGLDADAAVIKVTPAGSVQWSRFIGTPGVSDEARGIATDASDNVYVAGPTDAVIDPSDASLASAGGTDGFLRKYNALGNVVWTRQFGTTERDTIQAVAGDAAGNVVVVGRTAGGLAGPLVGVTDAFIRKYNASGTPQWTDQYGTAGEVTAGEAAALDADGNPFLAGDIGGGDVQYVRKYSAVGGLQWTRQLSPQPFERDVVVAADGNGDAYLAGMTFDETLGTNLAGGDGGDDAYVRRYLPNGAVGWTIRLGGTGSGGFTAFEKSHAIAASGNGNVYLSGETTGTFPDAGTGGGFLARLAADVDAVDIQDAVDAVPLGAFGSQGDPNGQRKAMGSILDDVDQAIADGDIAEAIRRLENLRRRVDGCEDGPPADPNDWIKDCDVQDTIRALIDAMIDDLSS